jgi:hypothetical protein
MLLVRGLGCEQGDIRRCCESGMKRWTALNKGRDLINNEVNGVRRQLLQQKCCAALILSHVDLWEE